MAKVPGPKIRKKQQAYEFIRAKILDGEYEPGFHIIVDRVARDLDLSTIPVREAIQQLEAEGLIQVFPYSGAVVQLINENEYYETMEVLAILEGAATARAAKHLTETDIKELESLNSYMKDALNNFEFELFTSLNMKFHTIINNRCDNLYLIERLTQAWQRIRHVVHAGFSFVPQRMKGSVEEHDELIRMFRSETPEDEIEMFVRKHTIYTSVEVKKRRATPVTP